MPGSPWWDPRRCQHVLAAVCCFSLSFLKQQLQLASGSPSRNDKDNSGFPVFERDKFNLEEARKRAPGLRKREVRANEETQRSTCLACQKEG